MFNKMGSEPGSEPGPEPASGPDSVAVAELWRMPELTTAGVIPTATGREKEKAREEGYAEGFNQGLSEGREAAQAERQQLAEQFRSVAMSIDEGLRHLDDGLAEELVNLACTLATGIVRRELKADPAALKVLVSRLVGEIPGAYDHVTLELCPADAEAMRGLIEHEDSVAGRARWAITDNPQLESGDCVIRTADSILKAEIWRQTQVMLAASITDSDS